MRALLILPLVLALCACKREEPAAAAAPKPSAVQTLDNPGALSDLELAARPPDLEPLPPEPEPIDAADAKHVAVQIISENGYVNDRQQYVVDLLELDMAYLSVKLETTDGRPVRGARPQLRLNGNVARISQIAQSELTDDSGVLEFGLIGQTMGEARLQVSAAGARKDVLVNVISLKAAGYPELEQVPGALRWEALMKARLRFTLDSVEADFPADIAAHNGKTVKLVGFMMPLEPEQTQRRFLLTSNPPSCFFHVPGGPAGAVEVLAPKGVEASWDPIVLEGRFETAGRSEAGVIYRLRDARLIKR